MNKKLLLFLNIYINSVYSNPINYQQQPQQPVYYQQQPQTYIIVNKPVSYNSFGDYIANNLIFSIFMIFFLPIAGWIILYLCYDSQRNK